MMGKSRLSPYPFVALRGYTPTSLTCAKLAFLEGANVNFVRKTSLTYSPLKSRRHRSQDYE